MNQTTIFDMMYPKYKINKPLRVITLFSGYDSQCLTEPHHNSQRLFDGLRIRKLTPREAFRLMGVKDEDFNKVSKNQSDSSLYHLAGDSIVVNVLMAIFKELF